ncbi:glutathione S-transferase family protein [Tropicimonas sp. IMCC34043]|uniref:glutathione S-transferase family protein n=1 Tax=Tropicimonas sp. IMCC34043 TaxID=2248760 RepID=UPI000E241A28|nr:glutathione S-transferase N-terminal domain-containing protein [Tropicimonas sp. IMCC34043]
MDDLSPRQSLLDFPITRRWPPADPTKIQLYSFPTPNGVKVSIALEELGLPYEAHKVTLAEEDVKSPEFLSLNPNNKIPAIIDPDGPDGAPIGLFESGAILLYLANKTGRLIGQTPRDRAVVTQWLMFQMGGIGPMFGQLGYFYAYGGKDIADERPRRRYVDETRRLLDVLEGQLDSRDWIAGAYSIADIAIAPWLRTLETGYDALETLGWTDFPNVAAYRDRFLARPAVQRGLIIPPRD